MIKANSIQTIYKVQPIIKSSCVGQLRYGDSRYADEDVFMQYQELQKKIFKQQDIDESKEERMTQMRRSSCYNQKATESAWYIVPNFDFKR